MRRLLPGFFLAALFVGTAHAYTADDSEAALESIVPVYGLPVANHARSIVMCETHGSLDPNAIGDHGTSFGVAQLHKGGLLGHFYSLGYRSPLNPYEALEYLARCLVGEFAYLNIGSWMWTCG